MGNLAIGGVDQAVGLTDFGLEPLPGAATLVTLRTCPAGQRAPQVLAGCLDAPARLTGRLDPGRGMLGIPEKMERGAPFLRHSRVIFEGERLAAAG